MSSSTSSSEAIGEAVAAPARATRIALVLLVVLCGVEAFARLELVRMSKEFEQFRSYPRMAGELAHRSGLRIALVGAWIVHEYIDTGLLTDRLRAATRVPAHAESFSADHSYVNTWYFMLNHYFWQPGNRVDLVVVPFVGPSLYDKNEIEIGRLARFFTSVEDWPEVLGTDLATTAERADFLLSNFWASWGARERMQELVFTRLFPNYKAYAREQQNLFLAQQFANPRRARKARSLVALERLLRTAREHATPLCFVVFPTQRADWNQQPYAEPRRLIEASGVPYVDLRGGADVDTSIFADLVHMNLDGRTLYTGLLADALAPVLGPGSSEAGTAFAAGGAGG